MWVILGHLTEKGRREIVEEMKERDRGERNMIESEETEEITRAVRELDYRPATVPSEDKDISVLKNFVVKKLERKMG